MSLLDSTRALLIGMSEVELAKIAGSTGVSVQFLYKLRNGDTKDPGVNKVQRVYEQLTGTILIK